MQSIIPFLWFDNQAEDAANFYVQLLPNAEIVGIQRYPKGGRMPAGLAMTVSLRLGECTYTLLNGGPHYTLNGAFSLLVNCEDQAEVDRLWSALEDGGSPIQCGWITDKFGLTWQIVPKDLFRLMSLPDKAAAGRVMQCMQQMVKLNLAELEAAAAG